MLHCSIADRCRFVPFTTWLRVGTAKKTAVSWRYFRIMGFDCKNGGR